MRYGKDIGMFGRKQEFTPDKFQRGYEEDGQRDVQAGRKRGLRQDTNVRKAQERFDELSGEQQQQVREHCQEMAREIQAIAIALMITDNPNLERYISQQADQLEAEGQHRERVYELIEIPSYIYDEANAILDCTYNRPGASEGKLAIKIAAAISHGKLESSIKTGVADIGDAVIGFRAAELRAEDHRLLQEQGHNMDLEVEAIALAIVARTDPSVLEKMRYGARIPMDEYTKLVAQFVFDRMHHRLVETEAPSPADRPRFKDEQRYMWTEEGRADIDSMRQEMQPFLAILTDIDRRRQGQD
jgi:hypothetical protein